MEIYEGTWGTPLRQVFTFVIPILVVVNVPARFMVKPLLAAETVAACRFCGVGGSAEFAGQPMGFYQGVVELSECEQLGGIFDCRFSIDD